MYYFIDFDITSDLAGIYYKEETCKYLTENVEEYNNGYNVIVDNLSVSKDQKSPLAKSKKIASALLKSNS